MDERKDFISRIGTFAFLLGLLLIILFVASDISQSTNFWYFLIGVGLLAASWYFKKISAMPKKPSNRFEGIRKIQQRQKEAQAKKDAAQKNQKKK